MKHQVLSSLSLILLILHFSTLTLAQTATAPAPSGPTNITQILEKAGQFTTLIRLMKVTSVGDQINTQLNNSNQGMTVFAPPDNAFSSLKSGTVNSLSAQQQVALVQFHVLPNFISMTQFQTVSNPLRTQAGDASPGDFPLNVTTSGNQVNVSTGVDDATVANTIYTDGQLAVYQVDKVLQPMSIFAAAAPATAPAPATLKKKSPAGLSPSSGSDDSPADASGADQRIAMHGMAVLVFGVSLFALL
ncbi:fasciclin-like arabinogalactan protein 12 [Lycium ferocissimum]|uniref:fasciclin-like arabinogalactan protein 12 n=1 Tax=Lycium ferocissimum TaxID=112874 RepID=UPI0028164FEE|nr:fasciclin-like arabinogalactan protein 12 [Lycium ferocissimum]XP_059314658.1 fasciclin-like arabinogalactan protein 12 [Lycium ferocissimum]